MNSGNSFDRQPTLSNRPVVTIKLASTSDELMQCYALRAAVFMGEQQCPYWEEFDGNDYSASHVMLYVDGEPGASMRIRWFAGFAKLERAVILKRYRSMGLFLPFVDWVKEFARKKGYPRAYLHSQTAWKIMERGGFRKGRRQDLPLQSQYGAFACDLKSTRTARRFHGSMVPNRRRITSINQAFWKGSMVRGATILTRDGRAVGKLRGPMDTMIAGSIGARSSRLSPHSSKNGGHSRAGGLYVGELDALRKNSTATTLVHPSSGLFRRRAGGDLRMRWFRPSSCRSAGGTAVPWAPDRRLLRVVVVSHPTVVAAPFCRAALKRGASRECAGVPGSMNPGSVGDRMVGLVRSTDLDRPRVALRRSTP